MKVTLVRCDSCGKLLDDPKDIVQIDKMEFCDSCIGSMKRGVISYCTTMGADIRDSKAAGFIMKAGQVLLGAAINAAREEKIEDEGKKTAGFSS